MKPPKCTPGHPWYVVRLVLSSFRNPARETSVDPICKDREFATPETALAENDEIAFLPPASGGSNRASRIEDAAGHVFAITRDPKYVLRRSGLRTLLAPRNEALDSMAPPNAEEAEEFLNRHLLPGGIESFDLRRMQNVKTLAGESLPVSPEDGTFRIGPALIVRSDIPCTNGVIHVIDAVLSR